MTWALRIWDEAARDIRVLDRGVQVRVNAKVSQILAYPRVEHPLSGELAGCYSVRVADKYRIVFRLILGTGELEVIAVGKRENLKVYRIAAERIANRVVEAEQHDDPENRTAEPN